MRRWRMLLCGTLWFSFLAAAAPARADRLQGYWEGTARSARGEQSVTATFKKEGDAYTGALAGTRGEIPLKDIKLQDDQLTAKGEITSPQGKLVIQFKWALQGETLKGTGEIEIGGQTLRFDYHLKRTGDLSAARLSASTPAQPYRLSVSPPQPLQKQSLDYFTGRWQFKWIGRESLLGPGGIREGHTTFKARPDGRSLESVTEGKSEAGRFRESAVIGFDAEKKQLTVSERLSNGLEIRSTGDWTRALSIPFDAATVAVKGQTVRLKRTITPTSPGAFTLTEEISIDGGAFERLGQAVYTKTDSGTVP